MMKYLKSILLAVAAMVAVACEPNGGDDVKTETVTFSNVMLFENGYMNQKTYTEEPWIFVNEYDAT